MRLMRWCCAMRGGGWFIVRTKKNETTKIVVHSAVQWSTEIVCHWYEYERRAQRNETLDRREQKLTTFFLAWLLLSSRQTTILIKNMTSLQTENPKAWVQQCLGKRLLCTMKDGRQAYGILTCIDRLYVLFLFRCSVLHCMQSHSFSSSSSSICTETTWSWQIVSNVVWSPTRIIERIFLFPKRRPGSSWVVICLKPWYRVTCWRVFKWDKRIIINKLLSVPNHVSCPRVGHVRNVTRCKADI